MPGRSLPAPDRGAGAPRPCPRSVPNRFGPELDRPSPRLFDRQPDQGLHAGTPRDALSGTAGPTPPWLGGSFFPLTRLAKSRKIYGRQYTDWDTQSEGFGVQGFASNRGSAFRWRPGMNPENATVRRVTRPAPALGVRKWKKARTVDQKPPRSGTWSAVCVAPTKPFRWGRKTARRATCHPRAPALGGWKWKNARSVDQWPPRSGVLMAPRNPSGWTRKIRAFASSRDLVCVAPTKPFRWGRKTARRATCHPQDPAMWG